MASNDKAALRERLEACRAYDDVMPTVFQAPEARRTLREAAASLRSGNLAAAESLAYDAAAGALGAELVGHSAIEQVAASPALTDQVADFTDAGFNFVRGAGDLKSLSRDQRSAEGAPGEVTRVMHLEDSLLLETGRINVKLEDGDSEAAILDFAERNGLVYAGNSGVSGTTQFEVRSTYATEKCLELLEDDRAVFAEPDYIERIGQRYVPSEPEYQRQWHHRNINLPAAWNTSYGECVRVAFIDTGFHNGLADLALDPRFSGRFDNTMNGGGARFVRGLGGMPVNRHGTACAAMIGSPENGVGGIGVAFRSDLRAIACLNEETVGTQTTLARALIYAADPSIEDPSLSPADGADVIGCSLGPSMSATWHMRRVLGQALDDIAQFGRNGLGTPVFWAVTNGPHAIEFDEVCSHPEVIAVSRSTRTDDYGGSGVGPELEFVAPGVEVHLPNGGGIYGAMTGTSFACPCATGVAALLLSRDKYLSAHAVRDRLRASCQKIGPEPYANGRNDQFGFGRIDAAAALS